MLAESLLEIAKGIGKLFINPLFYWIVILFVATGYKRIKRERDLFGTKIFPVWMEGKHTLWLSLASSIVISALAVTFGIVFTFEIAFILMIVFILLSITAQPTLLSASYTIGITFILILLLPFLKIDDLQPYIDFQSIGVEHYISLTLLIGIFLFIEAVMLISKKHSSFPAMTYSERGIWMGEHHVKRMAFIPFAVLFPVSSSSFSFPFIPMIQFGDEAFIFILLPFAVGFNYKATAELPSKTAHRIGQAMTILSLIVLACGIASLYYPILTFLAILIAILGKEWIVYSHKRKSKVKPSLFLPLEKGIKVLATIPNSPADRLGIRVGETILKVNGHLVTNSEEFYASLQNSGAFFKLDIIDVQGEIRFISSALYEEDHHELGIIFVEKPYRNVKK